MRIWKQDISLSALTAASANTAVSHLGIEFVEVGDDFLVARVPVNRQTCQPYGLLHGGVSVVLAETLRDAPRQYLNRLSDLLFVLARVLNRMNGGDDVYWNSKRLQDQNAG